MQPSLFRLKYVKAECFIGIVSYFSKKVEIMNENYCGF